ncbi:MAG: F0F1 ATP synthase subunit epsilon [Bacteroidales bacterium]|nr:F0F1 ATP synthase subunit epsilon [Bacteroidales bacterium]
MIKLSVHSPEGALVQTEVSRVELPGAKGRFVVLEDHAPLISSLSEGNIVYRPGDAEDEILSIKSGFVEICDNHVSACVEL